MDTVADALLYVFYAATIAALGFFIHKVLWLVQYKRIQSEIVGEAVRRLREGNAQGLAEWEEFAKARWSTALGQKEVSSPSTFIRRVEEGLAQVRGDLRSSRRSIADLLGRALSPGGAAAADKPATVLSLRRLTRRDDKDRYEVSVDLRFPAVPMPRPPDKRLFELKVGSRYSQLRRALVFFSGAANVVYSSQHVARMSQNVHVPTSTLVRRLGLVFLVLFFVFLDLLFKNPPAHLGRDRGGHPRPHARAPRRRAPGAPGPRGPVPRHPPRLRSVDRHLRVDLPRLLLLPAPALRDQRAEAPGDARRRGAHHAADPPRAPGRAHALGRRLRAEPRQRRGSDAPPRGGAHRPLRPPPPAAHRQPGADRGRQVDRRLPLPQAAGVARRRPGRGHRARALAGPLRLASRRRDGLPGAPGPVPRRLAEARAA